MGDISSTTPVTKSLGKRRIVDIENRKRALFSCDRCKIRKIKCKRVENGNGENVSGNDNDNDKIENQKYDNITPCIQCVKSGISCTTTMPRRKRFCSNVENSNLHYKCLLALTKGLFPDKDIYKIDTLIEIGKSFNFDMPMINENGNEITTSGSSNDNENENDNDNDNDNDNKSNTNLKSKKLDNEEEEDDDDGLIHITKNTNIQLPQNLKLKQSYDNERLIKDGFGHTHFIGNFGTASLLNGLCDIIVRRSFNFKPPVSSQGIRDSSVQKVINENEQETNYQTSLATHLFLINSLNLNQFPLVNYLKRKEADLYLDIFFEKVHPYYFIFNESRFRDKYEVFWKEIDDNDNDNNDNNDKKLKKKLNSSEICCIYMVWILGRRFQQFSYPKQISKNSQLNIELIGRYIDIIKLALSDIVLTPTINGIRLLIMFSVYLSSIKVRESGYCLMQLAAIQCKSLGLHRKLIVNKFSNSKSDEMKRILWSLAKIETTLCCSLGRASAIPWEDIDIDFPNLNDVNDELYKFYYFKSGKLTKIIFKILDNKKKLQREPLSLINIEKAIISQRELKNFWNELPEIWKDYKSLPIKRYKPKLHIQYHFYFITLTLPMILHIVNIQNYKIDKNDPIISLLIDSINSSFQTAEIVTYTNNKGFFNGTLYYDIFYSYNAIMVLTLTYILFKSNESKFIIDLNYLNSNGINLNKILNAINLIRNLILNNLDKIDGTMRRISDIIETLLEDLGIINILVETYNSRPSNVKKIEIKSESGKTSVSANIPTYLKKTKLNTKKINKTRESTPQNDEINSVAPVATTQPPPPPTQSSPDLTKYSQSNSSSSLDQTHPATRKSYSSLFKNFSKSNNNSSTNISNFNSNNNSSTNLSLVSNPVIIPSSNNASGNNSTQNLYIMNQLQQDQQQSFNNLNSLDTSNNQNTITPAAVLDTELMDLLFGGDLINAYKSSSDMFGYGYEE